MKKYLFCVWLDVKLVLDTSGVDTEKPLKMKFEIWNWSYTEEQCKQYIKLRDGLQCIQYK